MKIRPNGSQIIQVFFLYIEKLKYFEGMEENTTPSLKLDDVVLTDTPHLK